MVPLLPGQILLNDRLYRPSDIPLSPHRYKTGRAGQIIRLIAEDGRAYALKLLLPQFRVPGVVAHARFLAQFAQTPGLRLAERSAISPVQNAGLLRSYPDLRYALLMPWIDGPTWNDLLVARRAIAPSDGLRMARTLATAVAALERAGVTHAALEPRHIIIPPPSYATPAAVELLDLEQCSGPGVGALVPPQTNPVYLHPSDRTRQGYAPRTTFALALLITELLVWCEPEIRQLATPQGLFSVGDLQQNGQRSTFVQERIQARWGAQVSTLIRHAWVSGSAQACPQAEEWVTALATLPDAGFPSTSVAYAPPGGTGTRPSGVPVPQGLSTGVQSPPHTSVAAPPPRPTPLPPRETPVAHTQRPTPPAPANSWSWRSLALLITFSVVVLLAAFIILDDRGIITPPSQAGGVAVGTPQRIPTQVATTKPVTAGASVVATPTVIPTATPQPPTATPGVPMPAATMISSVAVDPVIPPLPRILSFTEPRLNGSDVLMLQTRLAHYGYDPQGLDGFFGPLTERAVISFQEQNGLTPDGVVGPQTWSKLFSASVRPRIPDVPIAEPQSILIDGNRLVIGGFEGYRWMRNRDFESLDGGLYFDRYSPRGWIGGAINTAGTRRGEIAAVCWDSMTVTLEPKAPQESYPHVALFTNFDPQPRSPIVLTEVSDELRGLVADWLQSQGMVLSAPRITQLVQVDIDGDGSLEELISTSWRNPEISSRATAGDYAAVLLRHTNLSKLTEVVGEYYPADDDTTSSSLYAVAAVIDLNGDGRLEIVLDGDAYESWWMQVYTIDERWQPTLVLAEGCGA